MKTREDFEKELVKAKIKIMKKRIIEKRKRILKF